jgi:hypothetical protein
LTPISHNLTVLSASGDLHVFAAAAVDAQFRLGLKY